MNQKRWIALLAAALLLLQPALALAESKPLLYKVTDDQGHAIYLLGTIHAGREEMYPLGDKVEAAWQDTDILALEMETQLNWLNFSGILQYASALMYGFGEDITSHLSPETYALGVEKLGLPEFMLKRMRPVAWYSLAENYMMNAVGLSAEWGVDMQLETRAKKEKRRIDELEGLESQLEALSALTDEMVDAEVGLILMFPKEAGGSLEYLCNAWQAGDEEALLSMLGDAMEEGETSLQEDYSQFSDALIDERNDKFLEKAEAYLQRGERALIAIGAYHIIGETGLATQLARAGYTVEEIGR